MVQQFTSRAAAGKASFTMKLITVFANSAILVFCAVALAGCDSGSSNGAIGTGGTSGTSDTSGTGGTSDAGGAGGATSVTTPEAGSANIGDSSAQPTDGLPMDSTGRVNAESNAFNIQGSWYWYADYSDGHAGLTTLADAAVDVAPYVEGKGMCIVGTTPGGAKDNYVTWGAGIGLNLNQGTDEDVDTTPQRLNPYPKCFTVTLSADSSSPGGILGKLLEANPMPGTTEDPSVPQEAPSIALEAGQSTDVCVDNVTQPGWCSASSHKPGDCADPKNLENGIAGIQIQALAGAAGGDINVCVVSIVPKN